LLLIASFLILLALILLWQAGRRRFEIGLPAGRVIYADTQSWEPLEQALFDQELGLTGRPDYLVEEHGQVIPVEVKSSQVSSAPYDAHIFQLAAYCLLVGRHFGKRPSYGILHYPNRTFAIDYTPELEDELLDLLDDIRRLDRRREVHRSHDSPARCNRCGYRSACEQRLIA
jgi:CRISPR-associated exonuclease Cas4